MISIIKLSAVLWPDHGQAWVLAPSILAGHTKAEKTQGFGQYQHHSQYHPQYLYHHQYHHQQKNQYHPLFCAHQYNFLDKTALRNSSFEDTLNSNEKLCLEIIEVAQ